MTQTDGVAEPLPSSDPALAALPSELLVQRSAEGDRAAFRALFDRHAGLLYAVALRIARHPNLAADTVQDSFMQAWQNARNYGTARGSPEAWLVGMTRFRALDLIRRAGPAGALLEAPAEPISDADLARLPPTAAAAALRAGLQRMEPAGRAILLLAYVDGLSLAAIGQRLGTSQTRLRATLHAALTALRRPAAGEAASGHAGEAASGHPGEAEEADDKPALYALGALNGEEMRALRQDAERDPDLAADIAAWEHRLLPLAWLAPSAPVPETVWAHLEARLARLAGESAPLAQAYSPKARHGKPKRAAVTPAHQIWRAVALMAITIAAGLGAALYTIQPDRVETAVILPDQPGLGAWLLTVHSDGRVEARARGALTHGLENDFELWVEQPGADRPFSIGLLPVNDSATLPGKHKLPPAPYRLLVTLEPKGGSASAVPTGPTVFVGEVGTLPKEQPGG